MPTMQAATYRRVGGPELVQIERLPIPTPGAHEVLVRVHASTVSVADHRARSRDIPKGLRLLSSFALGVFRPRTPVLGMDAAGVVAAVGEKVTRFRPGDEIIAMLGGKFGGHAEYVLIPEDGAITAKPGNMSFDEAVTLVFGGITARGFLNQVTIKPGDTVLVNGASGAVGTAMVQLVKQLGADVTGVCSAANAELVKSLGADRVIDYTTVDFLAEGTTYDVVVDCVGNAGFERAAASVKPGGALLLVICDLTGLLLASTRSRRSGKLVTANVGPYKAEDLAFLVELAQAGQYRAVIDSTYELDDIVSAHRYVDTGRKRGNVVVRMPA
ncbi:NAD(P)-dependent alcohol dehydrogenase [Salinibacterium sp. ZJ450]|uniref:NAD(P)-dependent alcohol dehydrogenase n=1 Tax=Salinibacterium sp. ZJ450 TaxID=2708338 RepID=UPI001CD21412|nr:NAD(P)-dependent alcohol dehydrogenase [Salinibacterium sp. ZJ450]